MGVMLCALGGGSRGSGRPMDIMERWQRLGVGVGCAVGLRCRGNSQRDGKDEVKRHLDSTAVLGCYGICVYCTAAGDYDRRRGYSQKASDKSGLCWPEVGRKNRIVRKLS